MALIIKEADGTESVKFNDMEELTKFFDDRMGKIMRSFSSADRTHKVWPGIPGADSPDIAERARTNQLFRCVLFPKHRKTIKDDSLIDFIEKALAEGTDSDGGFLVPDDVRTQIVRGLPEISELFAGVTKFPTSRDRVTTPKLTTDISWSWDERENETFKESEPQFGQIEFIMRRANAMTIMSRELVGDSVVDLVSFLTTLFTEAAAEEFDRVIAVGDGTKREPIGIENTNITQTVATIGVLNADDVIAIYHKLPKKYRRRATWVMNNTNVERVRKLKDGSGQYLWVAGLQQDRADTLMGRPIGEETNLDSGTISFGDLSKFWMIQREELGIETSTEAGDFFKKHQLGIKFWFRLDGKVVLEEAFANGTGITG